MDIELGMYFDVRTGEEVEVIATGDEGVMLLYHTDSSHATVNLKIFNESFIKLDAITEAANVLFSDN